MENSPIIEINDFISTSTCEMILHLCDNSDVSEEKIPMHFVGSKISFATNATQNAFKKLYKQTRLKFSDTNIHSVIENAISHHNSQQMTILLNNTFTYVKYDDGGWMPKHNDSYKDNSATHTIIIYLNDDYTNGEIFIKENDVETKIVPKIGKAIIFKSDEIPNGCHVVTGTKKILVGTIAVINAVTTSTSPAV